MKTSLEFIIKNRHAAIKDRMAAWIELTAKTYNSSNIAYDEKECSCVYHPIDDSPGCAIGHILPIEIIERISSSDKISKVLSDNLELFESDAPWILDFEASFLQSLQTLHDAPVHWDESGLTEKGEQYILKTQSKWINKV